MSYPFELPLFIVLQVCNPSISQIDVVRPRVDDDDGKPYLPLFTDTDLAERFIKSRSIEDAIIVRIKTMADLVEVFDELNEEEDHETSIIIDYKEGSKVIHTQEIGKIILDFIEGNDQSGKTETQE